MPFPPELSKSEGLFDLKAHAKWPSCPAIDPAYGGISGCCKSMGRVKLHAKDLDLAPWTYSFGSSQLTDCHVTHLGHPMYLCHHECWLPIKILGSFNPSTSVSIPSIIAKCNYGNTVHSYTVNWCHSVHKRIPVERGGGEAVESFLFHKGVGLPSPTNVNQIRFLFYECSVHLLLEWNLITRTFLPLSLFGTQYYNCMSQLSIGGQRILHWIVLDEEEALIFS